MCGQRWILFPLDVRNFSVDRLVALTCSKVMSRLSTSQSSPTTTPVKALWNCGLRAATGFVNINCVPFALCFEGNPRHLTPRQVFCNCSGAHPVRSCQHMKFAFSKDRWQGAGAIGDGDRGGGGGGGGSSSGGGGCAEAAVSLPVVIVVAAAVACLRPAVT